MSRPKGSKNKQITEEIDKELVETSEELEREEDLLGSVKEKRIFLGYHPITGVEVWH